MPITVARLALLALAKPKDDTRKPLVVAIGTKGDAPAGDWHVAFLDPDDLKAYLTDRPASGAVETLFDLPSSASLDDWLTKGAGLVGVSDGAGGDTKPRVSGPTFYLDGIARIHFFRQGDVFKAGGGLPTPLAWLDTAATVVDETKPAEPKAEENPAWVVSRLKLQAATPWPARLGVADLPKSLTSFSLLAHVPIAASAHDVNQSGDAARKRYDTRLILFAEADHAAQKRQLWFDQKVGIPEQLSSCFRRLALAFSKANSVDPSINDTTPEPLHGLYGLHDLTTPKGKSVLVEEVGTEDETPILALLPDFAASPPKGLTSRQRRAGFREVYTSMASENRDRWPRQLILRSEIQLGVDQKPGWGPLLRGLAPPKVELLAKLDRCFLTGGGKVCLTIAQEQMADAGQLRLDLPDEVTWLTAARMEQGGDLAVEAVLAGIVKDDQSRAAPSLRRLRPMTGMTLLGGFTASSDRLDWHVVGKLTHKAPLRRRLQSQPTVTDNTADWQQRARDREARWDLHSVEPVAVDNLWLSLTPADAGQRLGRLRSLGDHVDEWRERQYRRGRPQGSGCRSRHVPAVAQGTGPSLPAHQQPGSLALDEPLSHHRRR